MQVERARRCGVEATVLVCVLGGTGLVPGAARAGGGPENLLLLIDPTNAESNYVGNYYRHARNVPDRNVLYMDPNAVDYASFASLNLDALFGTMANRGIDDHIDYILVCPGGSFFVPAAGLFGAGACGPITRVSLSSAYTLAHQSDAILAGGLSEFDLNQFYSIEDAARAFDHDIVWFDGEPASFGYGRQYFIGFMLGYTGERGNTVDEIITLIDRSVAVDGTRPAGTFYFMKTTDPDRSPPRDPHFPAAIAAIQAFGGQAEQIEAVLPDGRHDGLSVLTGAANPGIDAADITLLNGAFCDHLTSFAGMFDNPGQEKMSRWIAKGASGSMGTVEEPCVVGEGNTWKFPHPRLPVWYVQGASLGEALFRSVQQTPFQSLFYGDPLTQPFACVPAVTVPDAPTGAVSGTIPLTPVASITKPGAAIARHELFVDGRRLATIPDGDRFALCTAILADGVHEVRVVSTDDTPVATQGRWIGQVAVNNHSRSVSLDVSPRSGSRSTVFTATVTASGGPVTELRLLHNHRVVAAGASETERFDFLGDALGAGPVHLVAEAAFVDQRRAVSAPVLINVTFDAPPNNGGSNTAPLAFSYTKEVPLGKPILLELPGSDREGDDLTYAVLSAPSRATLEGDGPVVLLRPTPPFEAGSDSITFQVNDGELDSSPATITLRYGTVSQCVPVVSAWGASLLLLSLLAAGMVIVRRQPHRP